MRYDDADEADQEDAFRRDKVDKLAPSWFVPRSRINEFAPDEIVFNGPEALVYPKGTFIYRLAGRDREKSASYYTPEPLARLLVKHALMERCRDLTADEVLDLAERTFGDRFQRVVAGAPIRVIASTSGAPRP